MVRSIGYTISEIKERKKERKKEKKIVQESLQQLLKVYRTCYHSLEAIASGISLGDTLRTRQINQVELRSRHDPRVNVGPLHF